MRTSWKISVYIGIFLTIFHIFCGICFEMVEADLLFDATKNENVECIEAFLSNSSKEVLLIGLEIRNICEEVCFQGRIPTGRNSLVRSFMLLLFCALLLDIAYVCRRLLEVSEHLVASIIGKIIFYIHQQDGKKDVPVIFS